MHVNCYNNRYVTKERYLNHLYKKHNTKDIYRIIQREIKKIN